jgi:hypothetical protein
VDVETPEQLEIDAMPADQQLKTLTPAQYAFVSWLYTNHPNIAHAAEERREALSGFMDSLTSVFNTVVTAAPDLMKQYVTGKQQIDLMKINLERAKANAYPLDANGSLYTGGNSMQQMATAPMLGVPTWAWIAGAGLLVYLVMRK